MPKPDIEYNEIDILIIIIVITARTYLGIHYRSRISYVNNSHWNSSSSITWNDEHWQMTFTSQPCNESVDCRVTETSTTTLIRVLDYSFYSMILTMHSKELSIRLIKSVIYLLGNCYDICVFIDGMSSIYLCNRAQSLLENVQMIGWFNRITDGDTEREREQNRKSNGFYFLGWLNAQITDQIKFSSFSTFIRSFAFKAYSYLLE